MNCKQKRKDRRSKKRFAGVVVDGVEDILIRLQKNETTLERELEKLEDMKDLLSKI